MMGFKRPQSGFTLVELLLALALFSFVLIISTASFIQINRLYHRTNTTAQTQTLSRRLINEISRSVRLAPKNAAIETAIDGTGADFICIGDTVYEFRLNTETTGTTNAIARYEHLQPTCSNYPVSPPPPDSVSLLDNGFYLRDILLQPVDNNGEAFRISITVSHGDDSTLEGGAGAGAATRCAAGSAPGSQFCAVSTLQTTVYRRL
jgi:prepilin-type N-terminal cleavage/methylation domain-containing protein